MRWGVADFPIVSLYSISVEGNWLRQDLQGKWWTVDRVPIEVQQLYANEGWSHIFYTTPTGKPPMVYPWIRR